MVKISENMAKGFTIAASALAVVGGTLTLIVSFTGHYGFNKFNLIDVAIFFGLAFGVFRKSRICAVILLLYHLASRWDMWTRTHDLKIVVGATAILAFVVYTLGIVGTFSYHSIQKEKKKPQSI